MKDWVAMTPIELQARREALGMSQRDLADHLGVGQAKVSLWERGGRDVPAGIDGELQDLEDACNTLTDRIEDIITYAVERCDPLAVLITHRTDESFWAAHPEDGGIPAVLHRVACARARSVTGADVQIVARP